MKRGKQLDADIAEVQREVSRWPEWRKKAAQIEGADATIVTTESERQPNSSPTDKPDKAPGQ